MRERLSDDRTGALPRLISPDLLWTGGCVSAMYNGSPVHGHMSSYLLRGSDKTILIDTGHPAFWNTISGDVETFLEGRALDYVFPTHAEFPHAGLLPQWLSKYPQAIAVGDVRDYRFYYPEFVDRMRQVAPGDRLDLGGKELVFLPAIWRDLPSTLWGFEPSERTLFVSDAFAFLHYHDDGQCDARTSEHDPPDEQMMRFFNERALNWTQHKDVRPSFADMERLLNRLSPSIIAAAHGGVVDNPAAMIEVARKSMISS